MWPHSRISSLGEASWRLSGWGYPTLCSTTESGITVRVLRRRTGIGTGSCFTRATALQMQGDHDHRELYRLTSYQPLPAHRVTVTVSSWACCFYLRAGRRHASFVIILIIFEILDVTMCNTMSVIRASSDQAPPPNTATFTCCQSAFLNSLKSKTGLIARATALRININTDGRPLPTKKRWRTARTSSCDRAASAS